MIGIIAAMEVEIKDLNDILEDCQTETISSIKYSKGKINGKDCILAVCGPGKVNASVCAQTMILKYSPNFIINIGVAGGIGDNINIGDVVVADNVVQYDMDTSAIGDPKGLISGINLIEIPCSKYLCEQVINSINKLGTIKFHKGTIATGDQFVNDNVKLNSIKSYFGAIACEMEGGSIGQVCYMNNVDFVVIRSISDNGNDNASVDYKEFVDYASKIHVKLISDLVLKLNIRK